MTKYDILADMTSTLVAREGESQWIVVSGVSISTEETAIDAGGDYAARSLVIEGAVTSSAKRRHPARRFRHLSQCR